jgi:hypothetical protein
MNVRRLIAILIATIAIVALTGLPGGAAQGGRIVSGIGTADVGGVKAIVEVIVFVPAGTNARSAVADALGSQGAKPVSNAYTYTGLVWNPPAVTQNYNPSKEPLSALNALKSSESTWSNVGGSSFKFTFGATTTRCPSLVRECPGPQALDGHEDVGWARLGGNTLGVTWSTTSPPEADMALNTRFAWSSGCTNVANRIDVETVLLHENGHVLGLGHSSDPNAIMYPSYQGARCALGQDDINGLTALY